MSQAGAPEPRAGHTAVLLETAALGAKMVVLGGPNVQAEGLSPGGVYDVQSDSWAPLPLDECTPPMAGFKLSLPYTLVSFTAFGNGAQALLWGSHGDENGEMLPERGWVLTLGP